MYKNILYENSSVLLQQYILLDIPYQSFWWFWFFLKLKPKSFIIIFSRDLLPSAKPFFFCFPSVCPYGLCYSVSVGVTDQDENLADGNPFAKDSCSHLAQSGFWFPVNRMLLYLPAVNDTDLLLLCCRLYVKRALQNIEQFNLHLIFTRAPNIQVLPPCKLHWITGSVVQHLNRKLTFFFNYFLKTMSWACFSLNC